MNDQATVDINKLLQTLGGVLLTICLALAGWNLSTAIANSERLTRVEAVKADRAEVPPPDVRRRLDALEKHQRELLLSLDARLDTIEKALARLEAK